MKKITQLILYNQLNNQYLFEEADSYLFLLSQQKPQSPYWPLTLNPISKSLEIECSKNFITQIQSEWKDAKWIEISDYQTWLAEYSNKYWVTHFIIMNSNEPSFGKALYRIQEKLAWQWITIDLKENRQSLISYYQFMKKYPKPPVMETFYRWMRKELNVLMDWDKPLWWERNYDKDNRRFDKNYIPKNNNTLEQGIAWFATTRTQAIWQLKNFVKNHLDNFWQLEDAMYSDDWIVHHSYLSVSLNFWLLTPWEVIKEIEWADTAINNKEWFIRQVLGRREYMLHWFTFYQNTIYTQNELHHIKPLPSWFWWPEQSPLKMNCVNHVLKQVKESAYSHHITRLMIIWNFTLLMWFNPHDVNKWFWEMYADAFERVVTPNVLGMSQFADGWKLATKPYISSANYINNMSDYCKKCYYDPKLKEWPLACPFNYLYRNFIEKHWDLFKRQPYITSNLSKVNITEIKRQAEFFIENII